MRPFYTTKQRVVRSSVWTAGGALIIAVRGSLFPNNLSTIWITIGLAMVAYGLTTLAWTLFKRQKRDEQTPAQNEKIS